MPERVEECRLNADKYFELAETFKNTDAKRQDKGKLASLSNRKFHPGSSCPQQPP